MRFTSRSGCRVLCCGLALTLAAGGCTGAKKGAGIGGAIGAATGAVIGHQGGKTGTGTGLFTVYSAITVTAPSAVSLGLMAAGVANYGASSANGAVSTNAPAWQVTATDTKGTNTGYMVKAGPTPLTNMFNISTDNLSWSNANATITYGSLTSFPFYVKQLVAQNDAGGSYTITITFTGSVQ